MNSNQLRSSVIISVSMVCVALGFIKITLPHLVVPIESIFLFALGVCIFALLGRPTVVHNPSSVPDKKEDQEQILFHDARKKLIDWMKLQGIILLVFLSATGLVIIREAVRSQVHEEVEAISNVVKKAEHETIAAKTHVENVIQRSRESEQELNTLKSLVRTTLDDLNAKSREQDSSILATKTLISQVEEKANETLVFIIDIGKVGDKTLISTIDDRIAFFISQEYQATAQVLDRINQSEISIANTSQITASIVKNPVAEAAKSALTGSNSIPELLNLLQSKDTGWQQKFAAIERIGDLLPLDELVIEPISSALIDSNSNSRVRIAAAETLGLLQMNPDVAVPAMINAISDQDASVSEAAIKSLARYGHSAKMAVASLLYETDKNADFDRVSLVWDTLISIAPADSSVQSFFAHVLTNPDWTDQLNERNLVFSLFGVDSQSEVVAKALAKILDPKKPDSLRVAQMLGKIGGVKYLDELTVILLDNDANIEARRGSAWGIGHIGGEKAVNSLERALDVDKRKIAVAVIEGLGIIGPAAATIIPKIGSTALKYTKGDEYTTNTTAWTFGMIGEKSAIPYLKQIQLNSPDSYSTIFITDFYMTALEQGVDETLFVSTLTSDAYRNIKWGLYEFLASAIDRDMHSSIANKLLTSIQNEKDDEYRMRQYRILPFLKSWDHTLTGQLEILVRSETDPGARQVAYNAFMEIKLAALRKN